MIFSRSTLLVILAATAAIVLPQAVLAAEGFTPLTQIPGIENIASSSGLPEFLNNIYQLCIGAAAVLAVLQIMRGGVIYMMGDSITEKKEAKDLIVMSIVGLLLVLSPAIVFGIIDPRILNLNVGFDRLNPGQVGSGNGQQGAESGTEGGEEGEPADGDDEPAAPEGDDEECDPETEEEVFNSNGTTTCEPLSEVTESGVGVPQPVQFRVSAAEGGKRYIKATYVSGTPAGASEPCNLIEFQQDYYSLSQCPATTPSPYREILGCQEVTGLPKTISATVPGPRCNQPQFNVQ
ncbi:pilin [Patescibacteria group bacterium]|nr:pilin [Patescibacteria group bacterium]